MGTPACRTPPQSDTSESRLESRVPPIPYPGLSAITLRIQSQFFLARRKFTAAPVC